MKYRKWDAKTKGMIVLEGLKGKRVCDIEQMVQANDNAWMLNPCVI